MKLKKSLAAACFIAVLLAGPAALAQSLPGGDLTGGVTGSVGETTGGVTDTVGGTGGVTDTVDGTTGGVTGTVDDVTDGVTDTVDGATGGSTGAVTDTVGDTVDGGTDAVDETTGGATDNVEETTGGVTNTVGNVTGGSNNNSGGGGGNNAQDVGSLSNGGSSLLDGLLGNTNVVPPSLADIPANLIDDLVDRAASKGGLTPAAAEGWIEGEKLNAKPYSTPLSSVLALTTLFENTALDFAQTTQVAGSRVQAEDAPNGSFFADAGQIAIDAAKTIAFPLALALLAVGFLMAQGRFGRKDPKLVLAPIDTRDQSLTFE